MMELTSLQGGGDLGSLARSLSLSPPPSRVDLGRLWEVNVLFWTHH